jgi:outer membrane receptor for ferrienterochelin and colicin
MLPQNQSAVDFAATKTEGNPMKTLLCSAIALTFLGGAAIAEPVKMTPTQLDEVTAAGAHRWSRNVRIRIHDINAAVNVISESPITNSVVNQLALALQNVNIDRGGRLIINISQDGYVRVNNREGVIKIRS